MLHPFLKTSHKRQSPTKDNALNIEQWLEED